MALMSLGFPNAACGFVFLSLAHLWKSAPQRGRRRAHRCLEDWNVCSCWGFSGCCQFF